MDSATGGAAGGAASLALNQLQAAKILGYIGLGGVITQTITHPSDFNILKLVLAVSTYGASSHIMRLSYGLPSRIAATFVGFYGATTSFLFEKSKSSCLKSSRMECPHGS